MSWHAEYFRERGKMNLEQYVTIVFGEPHYNDQKGERFHRMSFLLNFGEFSKAEVLCELESIRARVVKVLDGEIDYIRNTEFDE